jgi:hypothetical protein
VTNSAKAVHSRLRPLLADDDRGRSGVFLSPVNNERLRRILPSPLDEVAGVFHMKAYIVVIGHGIVGKDIPIMARLAEARRWSKR